MGPLDIKDLTYSTFSCFRHLKKKKEKHLTFPLFRDSTFAKQGKCYFFRKGLNMSRVS